ncbi:hypothetical protein B0H65DRAFT_398843, partial [Neurospora tetraspora]
FLIAKRNNSLRLMNNIQKINAVILRNSNIPPNYKTFNKKFKGYKILSLFNLYSGYN